MLLREEGVTFQPLKTWKSGKDPDYAAKRARIEHLYAIADREGTPDAKVLAAGRAENPVPVPGSAAREAVPPPGGPGGAPVGGG